jgi:glutathione synthase/RimK-type ligase-like ATP-grasp enzyme
MRVILFPYNMETVQSDARIQERIEELRPDLDCIRVYPNRAYRPTAGDLIVGWGAGDPAAWYERAARLRYLNKPSAVAQCVSKITTLRRLAAGNVTGIVPWAVRRAEALTWAREGYRVMARTMTEGRDGEGAQILNTPEEVTASDAPLYTMFIPKAAEYRVHVFDDAIIGKQLRVRRDDAQITNQHIRTSANGWGLTRDWDVEIPALILEDSRRAVASLGLTFGAVDIGVDRWGRHFVFEVNSAPEVLGPGVDRYARAILAQLDA